ncbi:MAG: secE [Bacillota bacterium]|nr:MAG: secE [Bacillota bacterium]MBS3949977.1 preprotein translocase subunit SecE [Peptococcaceae bacterium]
MKFFQNLAAKFRDLAKFLRDVRTELRKVIWPSRKQTVNYTLVVLFAVVFVAALISVTDAAFSIIIRRLLGI